MRRKTVRTLATTDGRFGPEEHLACDYCGWTWVRDVAFGAERKCPKRTDHGRLDRLADRRRDAYEEPRHERQEAR